MLTPIDDQGDGDGMMSRKFGRIVNITSAAVKAPIGFWDFQWRARRPHPDSLRDFPAQRRD
jgi:hypothetical protein